MRNHSQFPIPPKDAERPKPMGGNGRLPIVKGGIQPTVPAEDVPKPRTPPHEPPRPIFYPKKVTNLTLSKDGINYSDKVNKFLDSVLVVDIQSHAVVTNSGVEVILVVIYRENIE